MTLVHLSLTNQISMSILCYEVFMMTKSDLKQSIKAILRGVCSASAPLFSKKSQITADQARKTLLACSPCPNGTTKADNKLLSPSCDLQIIVPAYNVEKYLKACMDSVLAQKTKYSYHVILVDDGARDRTPEICDSYAPHPNVTVIHQKNAGLSGARNTGLKEIFGRYVMFLDSDDILYPGAIDALLDVAFQHDCDLVEGGANYVFDDREEAYHCSPTLQQAGNPFHFHGHAWGKVYKASLFEKLCFPEGFWYEDSLLSFLIFPTVKRSFFCPQVCYGYRINESGIVKTSVGKPRAVETYWITEVLLKEHQNTGLPFDNNFYEYLLLQARLNQLRLADLTEEIQEAAFVLLCDLMEQYYPTESNYTGQKNLRKALKTKDFGIFKMCCKFF